MNTSPIVSNLDESASMLHEADSLENEQQTILETASIDQDFEAVLQSYIQQKHNQVDRIEDKLSHILQKHQTQSLRLNNAKPNFPKFTKDKGNLETTGTKKQNTIIAKIENRLTFVKEIRNSMGLHEPRIEELATRKMRLLEPELTEQRDKEKARKRALEAEDRKNKREKEQVKKLGKTLTLAKTTPL